MIEGLLVLLLCQTIGELAARGLALPVPGPVLGMLVLLAVLAVRRPPPEAPVVRAGDRLLGVLPLLFVPAGVGIMAQVDLIRAQWLPIVVTLFGAWVVTLLATAGAASLVLSRPNVPVSGRVGAEGPAVDGPSVAPEGTEGA